LYRDASGTLVNAVIFYNAVRVPPSAATIVHTRGVVANLATNVVDATRSMSTIGELEIGGD
jgi:conjugal transfer/entry exclusion protein